MSRASAVLRPVRSAVRGAIDRLPVGGQTAMRLARAAERRLRGEAANVHALPKRYRILPRPKAVEGPWPEPPAVDEPMRIVRAPSSATAAEPIRYDIDLFETLNAEYASRPLVPAPRGTDEASTIERARGRLEAVHDSIDLSSKRVLEFGCGAGYEVWTVARRYGADAVGVDVEQRQAWAALQGDGVSLVKADIASDRPFAADSFDRVVSFSVFEHVVHPHASAAELFRIMRPGGLAWISANLYRGPKASHRYREVYFPWPHILFQDDVFREFYRRLGRQPQGAAWVNRYGWRDYEAMFRRVGFATRSLRFSEQPIDEAFYARFEDVLGRYPRWDLERDFFHVVLEKPKR